jgi:hypothetical protein
MDPECMEVGDSIITLPDGSRYSAFMVTREEISRIMDREEKSGASLGGSYLCMPDSVPVAGPDTGAAQAGGGQGHQAEKRSQLDRVHAFHERNRSEAPAQLARLRKVAMPDGTRSRC